ncbi:MAG TPA: MFS transporter [Segeticoccus sp.]|uniref:CynX/NimT family MFS transporter n=1 Tax=Segeticoccus sp. TaxID=2706531 RepID=UPI002D7F7753|nr:MFS transporter [Segeticoccus sp.]HET8601335.1 MFS transporter [Segeticoccus sp.]
MTDVDARPTAAPARRHDGLLVILAVLLVAANMRAALSGIGPVLDRVQAATGMSATLAGVVTTLPVLSFAAVGGTSPALARRWSLEHAIGAAVLLLGVAEFGRVLDGTWALLVGTAAACAGIAVINVLLPVVIKQRFPHRLGSVTGLYTASLNLFSALAAATTAPLADRTDWRWALGCWGVLALLAAAVWQPVLARHPVAVPAGVEAGRVELAEGEPTTRPATTDGPDPRQGPDPTAAKPLVLWRHPIAWGVAVYFGMQSLLAYITMGWLPAIYRSAGVDSTTAGLLLALAIVIGVPVAYIVPTLAGRRPGQRAWAVGLTTCSAAGVAGLIVLPAQLAVVWAILIGLGQGCFPLALALFGFRTRDHRRTAALSAFGQSVGYLLAVVGPLGVGVLHDLTGGWTVPLLLALCAMGVQAAAGMVAGRPVRL